MGQGSGEDRCTGSAELNKPLMKSPSFHLISRFLLFFFFFNREAGD